MRKQQFLWYAAIGTVVALILAATLHPVDAGARVRPDPFCLLCGDRAAADAALNVGLFVPLGIVLALGIPGWPALALPACLSAGIELLQLMIPGRNTLLTDLLANSAGGALGVMAVRLAPRWLRPSVPAAGRLALGWGMAAAALVLGTGWLLQPSWPDSTYHGQWTARLGHLSAYEGSVRDARVGGLPVPSRRLDDSEAVRNRLAAGAPIEVRFVAGPAPPGLAPVFSIFDHRQREVVLVGAREETFVLRYRSRAAALRFRPPALERRGALAPLEPGDSVRLTVWRTGRPGDLCAGAQGIFRACPLGHTPGRGWALLRDVSAQTGPVNPRPGLDFLWMAFLGIPLGFWLRPTPLAATGLGAYITATLAVPSLFPFFHFSGAAVAGAVAGLAVGRALGVALTRRRQEPSSAGRGPRRAGASTSRQRSMRL